MEVRNPFMMPHRSRGEASGGRGSEQPPVGGDDQRGGGSRRIRRRGRGRWVERSSFCPPRSGLVQRDRSAIDKIGGKNGDIAFIVRRVAVGYTDGMPRTTRASVGGVDDALNRGNRPEAVFHKPGDYDAFGEDKGSGAVGEDKGSGAESTVVRRLGRSDRSRDPGRLQAGPDRDGPPDRRAGAMGLTAGPLGRPESLAARCEKRVQGTIRLSISCDLDSCSSIRGPTISPRRLRRRMQADRRRG